MIKTLTIEGIIIFFAWFFPFGLINLVCWWSKTFFDIHDYYHSFGGDDQPRHFYIYHCWNCKKDFTI